MGDRAQVLIEDEGIYLYTHWHGSELKEIVRKALAKKWRWNDSEYLARIVFDEMVGKGQGQKTGFGIGSSKHSDIHTLIEINCKNQTVKIGDQIQSFTSFVSNKALNLNADKTLASS